MSAPTAIKPTTVAAVGTAVFFAAFLFSRAPLPWSRGSNIVVTVTKRVPASAQEKTSGNAGAQSPQAAAAMAASAAGMPSTQEEAGRRYQVPVSDTQPSVGPRDAPVTIVNWCDFLSSVCRSADAPMKAIMREYEGRVRWVFRHLPTTPDAVPMHYHAQAVQHYTGRFWQVRERLLSLPPKPMSEPSLRPIAEAYGLDWDAVGEHLSRFGGFVGADIHFADQFGVDRPMGYFVNGRRLPRETRDLQQGLRKLIEEELVAAKRLVDSGISKDKVYEELTKDGYWGVKDDPAARTAAAIAKGSASTSTNAGEQK